MRQGPEREDHATSSSGSHPARRSPATARAGLLAAVIGVLALGLTACDAPGPVRSSPGASAAPSVSWPPLTERGQAARLLDELIAAAGSAHAIKVEFSAGEATLTVVIGQQAQTWAWRGGVVRPAETDPAYVGQAIFDPRDFALADLGNLFARARRVSGSSQDQRLHILEYSNGRVFMSVTTNPESRPVFFRQDGSLVADLDFTTAPGLREGLADVAAGHAEVLAVGLDATSGGLYALSPGPTGVVQTLRMPQLPARDSTVANAGRNSAPFDPSVIDPQAIARVLARLPELTGEARPAVTWVIEQRERAQPALYVTASGRRIEATLAGTIVSS